MRKEFDWDKFKNDKIAVHCKTEDEAVDFLKECEKADIKWCSYDKNISKKTQWFYYKEDTCYRFWNTPHRDINNGLMVSPLEYYKSVNYKIIEWSDYMNNKEFSKSSLVELNAIILRNNESRWLN